MVATRIIATNSAVFTSTSTWTVPAGVHVVYVDAVAPGGSGGGGTVTGGNAGGGGGGGGEAVFNVPLYVTPGEVLTITVPAAAIGGSADANGNAGGNITITGADNDFP